MAKGKGLSINQRNLYVHLLAHCRDRGRDVPCPVPPLPMQKSRMPDYLRALTALEEKGLIKVKRTGPTYRSWSMTLLP